MYCTYCKMERVESGAPCPNCGAPSPLFSQSRYTSKEAENPASPGLGGSGTAETAFGGQWEQPVPQVSFDHPIEPCQVSYAVLADAGATKLFARLATTC